MKSKGRTAHSHLAASGRALAAAVGVGESTVREYLSRPDWPVSRSPPWSSQDVAAIKQWQQSLQADRAAGVATAAGKVTTAAKVEQMLLTRAKRKRLEGQLVERDLLDGALEALARVFVAALSDAERALPTQLAGREPGEVERILHDRFRSIRESLSGRKLLEIESIEQATRAAANSKPRGRPSARR